MSRHHFPRLSPLGLLFLQLLYALVQLHFADLLLDLLHYPALLLGGWQLYLFVCELSFVLEAYFPWRYRVSLLFSVGALLIGLF